MGAQEKWDAAKARAEEARRIQQKAREFHETGNDAKAKRKYDELVGMTGGQRQAEKAIRDAGGSGATRLRRLFGR